jgi:hypothetical protein
MPMRQETARRSPLTPLFSARWVGGSRLWSLSTRRPWALKHTRPQQKTFNVFCFLPVLPNRTPTHRVAQAQGAPERDHGQRRVYQSRLWRDGITPRILRRDPVCQIAVLCEGRAPSTEVDHVIPIQQGGDESDENLQGACHADHSRKTRMERSGIWVQPDPAAKVRMATAPANLKARK